MNREDRTVHPYIPNSVWSVRQEMLDAIGVKDTEALFEAIPEELRFRGRLDVPGPYDEWHLRRHIDTMLNRNQSSRTHLNFLGVGCWQHFIPAVCDEISQRAEFVTAYAGEPYEDHGRFQALFEYQSLVAEVVDMDVVNVPTFDWAQAAATSLRMAARITGRTEVLLPRNLSAEKRQIIENYCDPALTCHEIAFVPETGLLDLSQLQSKLSERTAAVYFENPTFLGVLETQGAEIARMTHETGALCVVGVDPISLGVLESPSQYGADIICGDLQPLGIHMNYGGGQSGFIATHDDPVFVMEYPSRLFGITATSVPGEYGFGDVAYERTSFAKRENGKESVGTQTALWGITAGVYLSLVGPRGLYEIGQAILQKSNYARKVLSHIPGVRCRTLNAPHFKEFVVDFNDTGMTVQDINRHLKSRSIFGGFDLSWDFPELGQSALYCVTEVHAKEDIDFLAQAIAEAVGHLTTAKDEQRPRREPGNRNGEHSTAQTELSPGEMG